MADGAGDDGQGYNADTREYCPVDDPFVFDRVFVGADKCQAYNDVRKSQPVVTIEQEMVVIVYIRYALPDPEKPCTYQRIFRK